MLLNSYTLTQTHTTPPLSPPECVTNTLLLLLRAMTALEQKWLIRVLLKDLHLGLGQTAVFGAWHPDAKDYYDVNNSLSKVRCGAIVRGVGMRYEGQG